MIYSIVRRSKKLSGRSTCDVRRGKSVKNYFNKNPQDKYYLLSFLNVLHLSLFKKLR